MKAILLAVAVTFSLGVGLVFAAKLSGAGISVISDKPDKEAGIAALVEAERLAAKDPSALISIGRVYYLSGDKAGGEALFARATSGKQSGGDYQQIAEVYADAGDIAKAEANFGKMQVLSPDDDAAEAELGAWYIRIGQRAKGEEHLAKAFRLGRREPLDYVRAAEGLLGVPSGR